MSVSWPESIWESESQYKKMKNGLGHDINETVLCFYRAGLTHRVLREAACSARGSPLGWRNESDLSDFNELRQGLRSVPPI